MSELDPGRHSRGKGPGAGGVRRWGWRQLYVILHPHSVLGWDVTRSCNSQGHLGAPCKKK